MNLLNSNEDYTKEEIDNLEVLDNFKLIFENILSFDLEYVRTFDEICITLNNFNTY